MRWCCRWRIGNLHHAADRHCRRLISEIPVPASNDKSQEGREAGSWSVRCLGSAAIDVRQESRITCLWRRRGSCGRGVSNLGWLAVSFGRKKLPRARPFPVTAVDLNLVMTETYPTSYHHLSLKHSRDHFELKCAFPRAILANLPPPPCEYIALKVAVESIATRRWRPIFYWPLQGAEGAPYSGAILIYLRIF